MAYYEANKITAYYNGKRLMMFVFLDSVENVEGATLAFLANVSLSVLNGKLLSEFNSITPEEEQLYAPTISLDEDILNITSTDDRTEEFVIFVDGVEITAVIAFAINETSYTAFTGMTWGEWVESEYSGNEYGVNNGYIYHKVLGTNVEVRVGAFRVKSTDTIVANVSYSLFGVHGGGDN